METPHFEVERLRDDQVVERRDLSFEVDLQPEDEEIPADVPVDVVAEQAAVQGISPQAPAPELKAKKPKKSAHGKKHAKAKQPGLFTRMFKALFGGEEEEETRKKSGKQSRGKQGQRQRQDSRGRGRRRGGQQADGRKREDSRRDESGRDDSRRADGRKKRDDRPSGDSRRDDSQRDESRQHQEGERQSAEGGRKRGRRRGRDERPQERDDAVAASEQSDSQGQDRPRKRPQDQRGDDKPRRRRRGNRPAEGTVEAEAAVADTQESQAVTEVQSPEAPAPETSIEAAVEAPVEAVAESAVEAAEPVAETIVEASPEVKETPVEETITAAADDEVSVEPQAEAEVPATAGMTESAEGITESGRASNDPRIKAKPVDSVQIDTAHPELFSGDIAPPVVQSGAQPQRAENDPRGKDTAPVEDETTQEPASQQ